MAHQLSDSPSAPALSTTSEKVELKASTLRTYSKVFERCVRKAIAARAFNADEQVLITPMDLAVDWLENTDGLKQQTMNIHRAALLWGIEELKDPGWEEAISLLRANQTAKPRSIEQSDSSQRSRAPGRMIPENHLHALLNHLATRGERGARSQWFLMAGIASGARPIEWPDAEWVDEDKSVLRIFTAKVKARNAWKKIPPLTFTEEDLDDEIEELCDVDTPGRTEVNTSWENVDFQRRLSMLSLTEDERQELTRAQYRNGIILFRDVLIEEQSRPYVRLHMEALKMTMQAERERRLADMDNCEHDLSDEAIWDVYYNTVRHCIWRACKKVFPSGHLYSLVDTRSTFSANRKAMLGLQGASRDLGHQSITTSRDFYAPASKAWSRYKPKPGQESAAAPGQVPQPLVTPGPRIRLS